MVGCQQEGRGMIRTSGLGNWIGAVHLLNIGNRGRDVVFMYIRHSLEINFFFIITSIVFLNCLKFLYFATSYIEYTFYR